MSNSFASAPVNGAAPTVSPGLGQAVAGQEWSAQTIALATLTAGAVTIGFLLIYRFYMAVFLLFTALALQVAFQPLVEAVHRRGMRREMGVFLVYALLLLFVLLLVWFTAPLIIEQGRAVLHDLPVYYQNLRHYLASAGSGLVRGLATALPAEFSLATLTQLTGLATTTPEVPAGLNTSASPETTQGWQAFYVGSRTLFAIFAVFALAFYWTLERDFILRKLILRAPSTRRDELRALLGEIELKIGAYFRGQLILCVIIGVMSTLAFWLIGVPNALILGSLMGIFEAIPIIGPTLGAIPAVLLTLATAPERAIWVVVALLAIQGAENNFLVPRIMDQSVGVSAVVSILAIAAFGALFGITGAILAIPLAAILQIFLNRLLFNAPLAEETSSALSAPTPSSRGHWGLLRLQTQELAHDIRKQARTDENPAELATGVEEVEDQIELLAVDLDSLLAQLENNAEPPKRELP